MATFPVPGGKYTNDWGAPRSGGTRKHKGNDIFAPKGTAVYAVAGGRISTRHGGLGGNALWVDGKWYYAHLDRFAKGIKEGSKVREGQLIGYVGNTGDAAGGPTHLHFGYDPRGTFGEHWENPYSLLKQWEAGVAATDTQGQTGGTQNQTTQDQTTQDTGFDPSTIPPVNVDAPSYSTSAGPPGFANPSPPPEPPLVQTWRALSQLPDVSPETQRMTTLVTTAFGDPGAQ